MADMIAAQAILWFFSLLSAVLGCWVSLCKIVDRNRQKFLPPRALGAVGDTLEEPMRLRTAPLLSGRKKERVARVFEIASQIKTGDLVSFSGRSFWSYLIRIFCYSDKSHVGMAYVDDHGEIWVIDSCEKVGVTKHRLWDDVKVHPGQWYWHPIRDGLRHHINRRDAGGAALAAAESNTRYGWGGIVLQFVLHAPVLRTLAYLIGFASCKRFTERPFCSMGYAMWAAAGKFEPVVDREPQLIVPQDLCQSGVFSPGIALFP